MQRHDPERKEDGKCRGNTHHLAKRRKPTEKGPETGLNGSGSGKFKHPCRL